MTRLVNAPTYTQAHTANSLGKVNENVGWDRDNDEKKREI